MMRFVLDDSYNPYYDSNVACGETGESPVRARRRDARYNRQILPNAADQGNTIGGIREGGFAKC